jgi:Uma2 family endonuclease
MSSAATETSVTLVDVPRDAYEALRPILLASGQRHDYRNGVLETPSLLHGVSWDTYEAILEGMGDRRLYHSYDRGTLELMTTSKAHEWVKKFVARLIEGMALSLDIDIQCIGSLTLRKKKHETGLEPDECYYIANESQVRDKMDFDPDRDPPPDLAIEVDFTSKSVDRMGIYARLGIPEVWRCFEAEMVKFYRLGKDGHFREVEQSLSLPPVVPEDIDQILKKRGEQSDTALVKSFINVIHGKHKL